MTSGFGSRCTCSALLLSFSLISALMVTPRCLADQPRVVEAKKVEAAVYGEDSSQTVAVVKAERVFAESRRMGFFRVRTLPKVVAEGVRVELNVAAPNTNWHASFRAQLMPFGQAGGEIEWRDVKVRLPQDATPRLQAGCVQPVGDRTVEYCILEDVTLQTDSGPLKLARATLWLHGTPGRVEWRNKDRAGQWDLFKGSVISEGTTDK